MIENKFSESSIKEPDKPKPTANSAYSRRHRPTKENYRPTPTESVNALSRKSKSQEWAVKSGCHISCMADSKGIQIVKSNIDDSTNIQLCEADTFVWLLSFPPEIMNRLSALLSNFIRKFSSPRPVIKYKIPWSMPPSCVPAISGKCAVYLAKECKLHRVPSIRIAVVKWHAKTSSCSIDFTWWMVRMAISHLAPNARAATTTIAIVSTANVWNSTTTMSLWWNLILVWRYIGRSDRQSDAIRKLTRDKIVQRQGYAGVFSILIQSISPRR